MAVWGLHYRGVNERGSASLADAFDPRANSLGFLRILFATLVLVDHAFPIGGFHHESDPMWGWTDGQESFGGLAVAGFFVVSGFLVTRSFEASRNALSYAWKRFLRIFPGFWACLLVTVLLFGPIAYQFQNGGLHGYWSGPESPIGYLRSNALLVMNQYNIDGLLRGTPYMHSGYPPAFDGSLWTLIYEVKCYLLVALLGVFGVFRRGRFSVVIVSLALWTLQLEDLLHPTRLQGVPVFGDPQMMRLAFIFSLGMLLYLYREKIPLSDSLAATAAVVLAVGMRTQLYSGIGLVALAYLCMWLAVRLPLERFDRFGDFSYGVYIYAFPVEVTLTLAGVNHWGFFAYVVLCFGGTMVLAVPSWFLVEKRFLSLKRFRLRRGRRAGVRSGPSSIGESTSLPDTAAVAGSVGLPQGG